MKNTKDDETIGMETKTGQFDNMGRLGMLGTLGRILGDINNTRMDVNFTRGTKVDKQKNIFKGGKDHWG